MSPLLRCLSWLGSLDEYSRLRSPIHAIHPVAAIVVATGFVVTVMSFRPDAVTSLSPLFLYPILLHALSGIPASAIARPLLLLQPFILCVGLLNPWLDPEPVAFAGHAVARGWLVFASLAVKSTLAVASALLLGGVLGVDGLAAGMQQLRVPRMFVLQVTMTFRYIWVLAEEAAHLAAAYALRAGGRRGIALRDWGAVAGGLLLRTHDRAERVHRAMLLRGFDGDYRSGTDRGPAARDWLYMAGWIGFFLAARFGGISERLGAMMTGG